MATGIKILSDFDGVWTDQGPEAELLVGHCVKELARVASVELSRAQEELGALRGSMAKAPHEHGWAPDGRISAYVDEDPLIESSALCHLIDSADDDTARRYREAVHAGGFASLAAFASHVFISATAAFREDHPPCLVPGAATLLEQLHAAGAEVVIISNSSADKIIGWLTGAGIDAGVGPGHAVRVRGDAAKWQLGRTDAAIGVADRRIFVDRPRYRDAIQAEAPDLIIGDVFSLDLALPHVLRTHGLTGAPRRLALRHHAHTPSWVLETAGGGAIDHIVAGLGDLPPIVRSLVG